MKQLYTLAVCLPAFMSMSVMAQSPGGVSSNLSVWIRSDVASTLASTDSLNTWYYYNIPGNAASYTSLVGNRPIVQSNVFNFLPGVAFNQSEMDGLTGSFSPIPATSLAYSYFAVWKSNDGAATQRVWSQRSTASNGDGTALWLYNGQYGDQDELAPYTQGVGLNYTAGTTYISEVNLLDANTNDLQLIDQTNVAGAPVVLSSDPAGMAAETDRVLSNVLNRLGCRNIPTEEAFNGSLAELIIYKQPIDNTSQAQPYRNMIFSYLAMKYGISLGINLLSSAGTTIWDATANSTYNNSTFGLALDNASSLSVNQSNSSSTGSGNGTGQTGTGNITLTAVTPLSTDQSFLIVGNDNNPLTETTSNVPAASAGSSRLQRNWKVANTNSVGPVNMTFDFTGLTVSGTVGTPSDFRLITNDAGDPTFATGNTAYYTPASFTNNIANFNGVTLSDGSVFAILSNASGSTPLPVNWVSFTAQPDGSNVALSWVVGDNQQAQSYEIGRSTDGVTFSNIGEVDNVAGQQSYGFVDNNPGVGKFYYRIMETDLGGATTYSKVAAAVIGGGNFSVTILNNPASGRTDAQVQIATGVSGTAQIELWTIGGSRVSVQEQSIGSGTTTVSLPMGTLAPGSYVVKVTMGQNTQVAQLIKN